MNRKYLLDSLDGLKGLVFRLLPASVLDDIGCVPMTTDGEWNPEEKKVYEQAIGIPAQRTYWTVGDFTNVPSSNDPGRSRWLETVTALNNRYLFLDPDIGFCERYNGDSEKKLRIYELKKMLESRDELDAFIVYRHLYYPRLKVPEGFCPYVWHSLGLLHDAGLIGFAYQSQAASLFFISRTRAGIKPLLSGLRAAFSGISDEITRKRLIEYQ